MVHGSRITRCFMFLKAASSPDTLSHNQRTGSASGFRRRVGGMPLRNWMRNSGHSAEKPSAQDRQTLQGDPIPNRRFSITFAPSATCLVPAAERAWITFRGHDSTRETLLARHFGFGFFVNGQLHGNFLHAIANTSIGTVLTGRPAP